MCGRFTLFLDPADFQVELDLTDPGNLQPRYNIAPTQPVAAVLSPVQRQVEMLRWGLVPGWAKDPAIGSQMINARSETVAEKPSFRRSFERRRCLILTSGFYEWAKMPGAARKIPHFIHLANHKPFTFAGLWDTWRTPEGQELRTCTIITCPANALVAQLHERMPVILPRAQRWAWLDPNQKAVGLLEMLKPYPPDEMACYPVSARVSNPAVEAADLILPV
jgi:putative SOS response-associated peptidase YedK